MKLVEPVEHKTTTSDITPGSGYWKRLTLDDQISTYFEGVRVLGYEPRRMLYDVIRKPTIDPQKATPLESRKYTKPTKADPTPRLYANQREADETPEAYEARLIQEIGNNPEKYYQRLPIPRLEGSLDAARIDRWIYASNIAEYKRLSRWPRNPDACERYGSMCDFWAVCSGETTLDNPYSFEPKEPSKRRLPLLSASAMSAFRRCPKLYEFSYVLRYKAKEKATALRFGTLIHSALEVWWKSNGSDLAGALSVLDVPGGDPYERAKARAIMLGYHVRWGDSPPKTIGVEVEFEGPLVNPETGRSSRTFVMGGKIDAIQEVSE